MGDAIQKDPGAAPGPVPEGRIEVVKEDTEKKDPVLDRVSLPSDLRDLSTEELVELCADIRKFVIDVVSRKGGHLGASLGVVELTVALHRVLDLPRDRLVWDVGHQAYVHKILTGRKEAMWNIRRHGGISGFLKRTESEYDVFGAGHASTAISAALGLATARDLKGEDHRVVALIGDGAMTGGLAYEALNNAGQSGCRLLVVLNDNGMSISPNVGALAHYLTYITSNPRLKKLRDDALNLMERLPALGESVGEIAKRLESGLKNVLVPGGLFEALGFNYFGPVDGHDVEHLVDLLPKLLQRKGPVLLHVLTRKGKGLKPAEKHHESFHAVPSSFDPVTGKVLGSESSSAPPAYTRVFGGYMVEAARKHPNLVAITAAMASGTGLDRFKSEFPERFFDVGIAEAHAVCFAAGLACEGVKPVVGIYSTFLQRAFDQVIHDVALQKLPVVLALDRAGLVGADGPTHHGVLDLSYLRCIPGMVIAAPRDGNELCDLMRTAVEYDRGPFAVRFPRGSVPAGFVADRDPETVPVGSWERLAEGEDAAFLAVGTMVETALQAREILAEEGVAASVINCRFVKPMDLAMLREVRTACPVLVTVEENNLPGGFGDGVVEALGDLDLPVDGVVRMGLPDDFVTHGSREDLLAEVGLEPESLAGAVLRSRAGVTS